MQRARRQLRRPDRRGLRGRWVPDNDRDGCGQAVEPWEGCFGPDSPPPGGGAWVTPACTDCDDDDPFRAPIFFEWCDGIDNDCNGIVDDVVDYGTLQRIWPDRDGDGYGEEGARELGCLSPGWVEQEGDCDDDDPDVHIDAVERCNGIDDDCDGSVDPGCEVDQDGDGYSATVDCVDGVAEIHPEAPELCNGRDDDCDGLVDEGCALEAAAEPGCDCAHGFPPTMLAWLALAARYRRSRSPS